MTKQTLELLALADPDVLFQLLEGVVNASRTLKLPASMRNKATCGAVLNAMADDAGVRFKDLNDAWLKGDLEDNMVDWSSISPYKQNWGGDGERVTSIMHRPTGNVAQVPKHCVITDEFVVWQPWSDKYASAKLDPCAHNFHDLFADGHGPKSMNYYEGGRQRIPAVC